MDFDEQEDQEEEIGIQIPTNFPTLGNSGRAGGEGASTATRKSGAGVAFRYRECLKNHAVTIGGNAVDGCGEFMPAGEEGTLDALRCAACNCHRNFHRKEAEGEGGFLHHSHQQHHHFQPFYHRPAPPSGYLHLTPTPHHQRPLALPSTSRDDEDISNPSSSGGGGGGGGGSGGSKKRFRTKFTAEQKEKMLAFSERVGWRIQKQDEAAVQQFCAEANVKRHVLKFTVPKTEVLSLSHTNTHYTGERECIKVMKMMMKDKSERIEAQTWLTCAKG